MKTRWLVVCFMVSAALAILAFTEHVQAHSVLSASDENEVAHEIHMLRTSLENASAHNSKTAILLERYKLQFAVVASVRDRVEFTEADLESIQVEISKATTEREGIELERGRLEDVDRKLALQNETIRFDGAIREARLREGALQQKRQALITRLSAEENRLNNLDRELTEIR